MYAVQKEEDGTYEDIWRMDVSKGKVEEADADRYAVGSWKREQEQAAGLQTQMHQFSLA